MMKRILSCAVLCLLGGAQSASAQEAMQTLLGSRTKTLGINYFDIHVTDQNDERKWDIKYGYDGFFAGLIFVF